MKQIYSNNEIYSMTLNLQELFLNKEIQLFLPIKVNFLLQKNIKKMSDLASELEKMRLLIGKKYGILQPDGSYKIPEDKQLIAQQELIDLSNMTQEIDIMMISLSDLGDTKLTTQQMQALLFMIED